MAPVRHHPALAYDRVPAFMTELREREAMAARCLEFIILTGARAGEARGMKWSEVDFPTKTWIVPASRMKANREHRVGLSSAAMALLEKLPRDGEYVFPGGSQPRLSPMAIKMLLVRMGRAGSITTHGLPVILCDVGARADVVSARGHRGRAGARCRRCG